MLWHHSICDYVLKQFTLNCMGYFDYLNCRGGGGGEAKSPLQVLLWHLTPTVIKLGMIILWGKNFSNLAKQFTTTQPLFQYDVISRFHCIATARNSLIVISL